MSTSGCESRTPYVLKFSSYPLHYHRDKVTFRYCPLVSVFTFASHASIASDPSIKVVGSLSAESVQKKKWLPPFSMVLRAKFFEPRKSSRWRSDVVFSWTSSCQSLRRKILSCSSGTTPYLRAARTSSFRVVCAVQSGVLPDGWLPATKKLCRSSGSNLYIISRP